MLPELSEKQARERIARRLAMELQDGEVVNLGIGIPQLIPDFGHEVYRQTRVVFHLPQEGMSLGVDRVELVDNIDLAINKLFDLGRRHCICSTTT